jgi:hypothetical protein
MSNESCNTNTNDEFERSCRGGTKIKSEYLIGAYLQSCLLPAQGP